MRITQIRCHDGDFTAVGERDGWVPVGPANDATVLSLAMASRAHPAGWTPAPTADRVPSPALLPPLGRPPSIRDFYAFERHVATARRARGFEVDPDWYEIPVFYFTNPAAVLGPDAVLTPPARTAELDYELEVAMVLGAGGRDLRPAEVADLVAGYLVCVDWSARDLQRHEMRQHLGPAKGKDFATSLGPVLVTPDEFCPDPRQVPAAAMTASVNGRGYSVGDLSQLWWSFAEMACYASESADLVPGDVLGSGTVGTGCILELSAVHGGAAYPWLVPGDVVTAEVAGLGALATTIGPASGAGWSPDEARVRPPRV